MGHEQMKVIIIGLDSYGTPTEVHSTSVVDSGVTCKQTLTIIIGDAINLLKYLDVDYLLTPQYSTIREYLHSRWTLK